MSATEPLERSWSERRITTLKDVARSVGVSESVASVVLNGAKSGTRVSATTRRSVLEAAERLGYRPNAHARSLQAGRSNRLGIYSGRSRLDTRNLFFAELLGGMIEESAVQGTNTVIHTSGTRLDDLLDLVSSRAVDGLIVHPRPNDPILGVLSELRIPAVVVADVWPLLPSIVVDDASGGMLQAHHLARLGHRHILYKQAFEPPQSGQARLAAFVEVAASLGVRVTVHAVDAGEREALTSEDFALLTGTGDRPTAVVAWNDRIAERICVSLTALGLSIPADVAVVGFDGFHPPYAQRFELTTIRAPWTEIGRKAVSTLIALGSGENVPAVTTLPVEFVRGTTT